MTDVDILVVGSINLDMLVKISRLPEKGESLLGTSADFYPGGKGANQAVQISRLGGKAALVGRVGNDPFSDKLLRSLEDAGVRTSFILRDTEVGSGFGVILSGPTGDNWIVAIPQANLRVAIADAERARDILARAKMVVLQLEITFEVVQHVVDLASRYGVPVLLNPAPARRLPPEVLQRADYFVPNQGEAEFYSGTQIVDAASALAAAEIIRALGPKNVIITLGDQGAVCLAENTALVVPAYPVHAMDVTAAGDAFCGALAVAITQAKPLPQAIQFANAAGALCVTRPGAQPSLASQSEIEAFLHSHPA